jgi:uncharacterized protein (TIGR00730 family)
MSERLPRYRTGDDAVDRRLLELLDAAGIEANRDLIFEILVSGVLLGGDAGDRLDLKITNSALKEMRLAFRLFGGYKDVPKVTIFGSARTLPHDPLYDQTRRIARALADLDWMVVTGAGPGIMEAGIEGAGPEHAIGINIRLPFEQEAASLLANDPKLISMKYFFTRKLMLMKESAGFVCLPGGFGTLDELLELLTLAQTGKADPRPIVLLDVPGGSYWHHWERFMIDQLGGRGLISMGDDTLWRITDDVAAAVGEITGFYRNYDSLRFVGDRLVLRVKRAPTDDELSELSTTFADIVVDGAITRSAPLAPEVADDDKLELPRVALRFNRFHYSRLRSLIDALNRLPSVQSASSGS